MEAQKHGNTEVAVAQKYGRMGARKHGSTEAWKHRSGSTEAWKHGSTEARKHDTCHGTTIYHYHVLSNAGIKAWFCDKFALFAAQSQSSCYTSPNMG